MKTDLLSPGKLSGSASEASRAESVSFLLSLASIRDRKWKFVLLNVPKEDGEKARRKKKNPKHLC